MAHRYSYMAHDGHVIARVGDKHFLIDTGSPASASDTPSIAFAGTEIPVPSSVMGFTCRDFTEFVGERIDALVGTDVLNRFDILIDPIERIIHAAECLEALRGIVLGMTLVMDVPFVDLMLGAEPHRVCFDTGAKVSYGPADLIQGYPDAGVEADFYPGFGRFTTQTHWVPLDIGGESVTVRMGTLPELLGGMLQLIGATGIIGSELLKTHQVQYSPRNRRMTLARIA